MKPAVNLLKRLTSQAPLFGDELAARARQFGTTIHHTEAVPQAPVVNRLLNLLRPAHVAEQGHRDSIKKLVNTKGVNLDFAGRLHGSGAPRKAFKGVPTAEAENIAGNKLYEAQYMSGLLPETESLSDLMRAAKLRGKDPNAIMQLLGQRFPKGFVVKPIDGVATSAATMVTDQSAPEALKRLFRSGVRNNQGGHFSGRPGNLMVQERLSAQPLGRLGRIANNVTELHQQGQLRSVGDLFKRDNLRALVGGKLRDGARGSMSGGKSVEYRLHVIDGKVVPYATATRGHVLGGLPWRTSGHRRAEAEIQRQIDKLPADKLKGTWGLDVIKGRDGMFRTVETNPTAYDGGSGIASMPHIQDALAAAIEGRLPRYVKAQRTLQAAGLLGGAGLATAAAQ